MSGVGGTGAVGKVTALVTRLGANGPEVCVFDHARAGMQLPAGTLEPGEDVYAGARREAFEETGLDDLLFRSEVAVVAASRSGTAIVNRATYVGGRVIGAGYLARVLEHDVTQARIEVDGATGVVDLEVLSFDGVRHLVHFVIDGAAPDEWFGTSPDGGGHCDAARVAQALDHVYRPAKINYSVVGNLCPHVHCHLILQAFADDPHTPVNMNAQVDLLEPDECRTAIRALQQACG